MFEFTETIPIQASQSTVWEVLRDIESWWPASNPEHVSLHRLDDRDVLEVGARLHIREKIAGIPGEAIGMITQVEAGSAVTWEAPHARYRWFRIPITIGEGVTWRVQPHVDASGTTDLSAHVWATFPPGLRGRLFEAVFIRLLGGVEKDREHARIELRYLRSIIEQAHQPIGDRDAVSVSTTRCRYSQFVARTERVLIIVWAACVAFLVVAAAIDANWLLLSLSLLAVGLVLPWRRVRPLPARPAVAWDPARVNEVTGGADDEVEAVRRVRRVDPSLSLLAAVELVRSRSRK